MSEKRPGILQYTDDIKENVEFNWTVLENKPLFEQIQFYMKNLDSKNIGYILSKGKDDKLAKKHREKGNDLFGNDYFTDALDLYNQGIAFGKEVENLSICYANRSAVYFELRMFQKCLDNINKAKELNVPTHLMAKLNKRAADAQRLHSRENANMKFGCFDKLSKPASKARPFVVDCLEGKDLNDLQKRNIRTTNALVAGDIISIEPKPFSKLLNPKMIFTHCTFCLSTDAGMSMIPCKHCSTAMFCNEECYSKANELFHKIECPIIDAIYGMLSESMWLGLRTVLIAIATCGSVTKFEEFLTGVYEKKEHILEQIFERPENATAANDVRDLDQFKAIMNLPVDEAFSLEDCAGTAFALKLLQENTKLIDEKNGEFIATAIYKSMQVARHNALLLEENCTMNGGMFNRIYFYGKALYPFACNFNLSCAPNILLLNHNNSMLGVVMRPIPSGGVLSAGLAKLNHITGDRNYRQELKQKYLEKMCDCIACVRNYGRMENLRIKPNVAQPTVPNAVAFAASLDRKGGSILKQHNFLCDYLNRHHNLEYLTYQMAGAINQLIFTLGKMAHPPAIAMKLSESLGK